MATQTAYPRLVRSLGLVPADDAEDCGRVLAELRTAAGVSPAGLAALAGGTEQDVLDLEAGRVVPPHPAFGHYLDALGH